MVVLIDTELGKVCVAGDVFYNYRNIELNWPIGSFWDLNALMAGCDRLRSEADVIMPAHDWLVRERFPTGTIG